MGRDELFEKLNEREWYKNTNEQIKNELVNLPEDFDGFLWDLVSRSDEFEGVDVLRILKIPHGNFIITPVFEVRSHKTNQVFTYEYASFKHGRHSGFRGVIFLEIGGNIEYFLVKWTKKFSVSSWVYDTIGDFIQFTGGKLANFPKKVEDEIKSELGLDELNVKRFIDLGLINTDVTLSNRQASLFAAVIDANDSKKLRSIENKTLETKKVSFGVKIIPIKMLNEYIQKIDDSYFLAVILRLVSMGIIKI